MSNFKKCPECGGDVRLMPIREPLPEPASAGTHPEWNANAGTSPMVTYTVGSTMIGSNYSPTSRIYKCPNPKCWVTKITESWE